jgi:hypothetical protein
MNVATEGWSKLHKEEIHNLHSSLEIRIFKLRRVRWVGHVVCIGSLLDPHINFVEKPGGKRLLGRPKCRCEDNIKMDLKE